MSQVDASKRLQDKGQIRLAAFAMAYNSESQDKSSTLYPMAPCYKEISEFLIKDKVAQGQDINYLLQQDKSTD